MQFQSAASAAHSASASPANPIAVTLGDPAGIGPEIIARAFRDFPVTLRGCFVAGDVETMRRATATIAGAGHPRLPVLLLDKLQDLHEVPPRCVPVLQVVAPPGALPWGQVSSAAGRVAADCVQWAARAALRGDVAALVTAPINKEALSLAGVRYPGHTELLQAEAAQYMDVSPALLPVRMMLASDELRVVLVSIHMALRDALDAVNYLNVLETLRITHDCLLRILGRAPRIGVAGLNPHAGEGGLFGREELEVIGPAVAAARLAGLDVHGPFAPDTVFMRARSTVENPGEFDVVVAMYHDQGLIPLKYLGVDKGVNITLGLPMVRTSPDHGTAFDIAGRGLAKPASLVAAVRLAREMV